MMANTPSSSASVMPQTVGAKTASSQSFKYPSIRTQAPSFDVMMAGTSAPSAHSSGFQHSGRGEKDKACQWVRPSGMVGSDSEKGAPRGRRPHASRLPARAEAQQRTVGAV